MSRLLAADESIALTRVQLALLPSVSVIIGSMLPLIPIVAQWPILPPLGLMMFLAWRLLRPEIWAIWAGLPFGLLDDLISGNRLGTSVLLWTAIMIALDMADNRMIWRDYWLDWLVAAALLVSYIILAMTIATLVTGGWGLEPLLPQIAVTVLLVPFVMRFCARLDRWRLSL